MEFDGWSESALQEKPGRLDAAHVQYRHSRGAEWAVVVRPARRHKNIVISHLGIFLLAVSNALVAFGGEGVPLRCVLRPMQESRRCGLATAFLVKYTGRRPRPATSASSQGPGKSEVTPSASTNKATLSCQRGRPKPHVREAQGI